MPKPWGASLACGAAAALCGAFWGLPGGLALLGGLAIAAAVQAAVH